MNPNTWGLRKKTIFLLLAVGLVPFCIAAVSGIGFFVSALRDSLGNSFHQIAHNTGERVNVILNREIKVIEAIAGSASILREAVVKSNKRPESLFPQERSEKSTQYPDKTHFEKDVTKRLRDVQSLKGLEYLEILVTDAKGKLVASTGMTKENSFSQEEWWRRTVQSKPGEIYVSDIYFDTNVKDNAVAVCVPVRDEEDKSILGVIKAVISWRYLFNPLVALKVGKTGHAFLMDEKGQLRIEKGDLAGDFKKTSRDLHLQCIQNMLAAQGKWSVEQFNHAGTPEMVTAVLLRTDSPLTTGSLGGGKWFIVLHQSEAEALAPVRHTKIVLTFTALGICALIILVGIAASRKLVCPILDIKKAAESIGVGNFDYHLTLQTQDEIEDLSHEVNRMAEKLKCSHSLLEQQVAERTKELQDERNFLDSVLKSLEDALIVFDRTGRMKMCSPSVRTFFGFSPDDLADIKTFIEKISPNEETTAEIEEAFWSDAESSRNLTCCFKRQDGFAGWMKLFLLFTEDRQYVVFNAHDITQRKKAYTEVAQARAELDQIFNVAGDGIRVVDRDFSVLRMNDAFLKLCGRSREQIAGMKCFEALPNSVCASPDCPVVQVLNGRDFVELETLNTRRDGIPKYCSVIATPFRDAEGRVIGAVEVFKDLTKVKDMQAQLLQSEKLASVGQLAAGIAHEINNPVGFINSNLMTLDEYRRDLADLVAAYIELEESTAALSAQAEVAGAPGIAAILRRIHALKQKMDLEFVLSDLDKLIGESREGTDRVKKIVNDLKDFAHVDQAELMWADLNKGLESTLNIVRNEIKYKANVIKDYGQIPEVYCYPQQINQVFTNILVNAAQAIVEKGEIKISSNYLDTENPAVEIRISDTGKGIHPDNLTKIFDPFFTTKPIGQGTGLGLSVAYNIIQKHNGDIKVQSRLGEGTTLVITLPVQGPDTRTKNPFSGQDEIVDPAYSSKADSGLMELNSSEADGL